MRKKRGTGNFYQNRRARKAREKEELRRKWAREYTDEELLEHWFELDEGEFDVDPDAIPDAVYTDGMTVLPEEEKARLRPICENLKAGKIAVSDVDVTDLLLINEMLNEELERKTAEYERLRTEFFRQTEE